MGRGLSGGKSGRGRDRVGGVGRGWSQARQGSSLSWVLERSLPAGPSQNNPEGAGCTRPDSPGSAIAGSDFRVWRSRFRPALGAALWARRRRRTPVGSAWLSPGSASPETPRARVSWAFGGLGCECVRLRLCVCMCVNVCAHLGNCACGAGCVCKVEFVCKGSLVWEGSPACVCLCGRDSACEIW